MARTDSDAMRADVTRREVLRAAALLAVGFAWPRGAAEVKAEKKTLRVTDAHGELVLEYPNAGSWIRIRTDRAWGINLP